MNLAKKGTVLLTALSVFALTSCGGGGAKTLTQEEARDFLKDAKKTEEVRGKYKVKDEVFSWDCKVTGTGMTPGEEGYGTFGAAQFLVGFLANRELLDDQTKIPEWLEHFKNLKDEYTSVIHANTELGLSATVSYVDQEGFDDITEWQDCENYNYTLEQNLLHISFDRTEKQKIFGKEVEIKFVQEIAVDKDGFVKYWGAKMDNVAIDLEIKITQDPFIKANGTLTGTVKCVNEFESK